MKIKIDSQIRITNPSKEILDYIKTYLEIKNPEVQKKQAMGFWAGNIPQKLKMYSRNGDTYILPLGCIEDVWNIHKNLEDYTIDFGEHKKLEFPKNSLKLYDYQEIAVNVMIKQKRGILESKCR